MKKYFFLAALAATALASCTNDEFVGDVSPTNPQETEDNAIHFGLNLQNVTRADIGGDAAATLLGNHFYVTGTKGTEATDSPSPDIVFDNYLVHYGMNTAGKTESNTANWEYVGVTPGTAPYADYVKLSSLNTQTIKFWDYSVDQYDFLAFSTGTFKAVSGTSGAANEIGVTAMKYGTGLKNSAVAYTFDIPSVAALKSTYFTDITKVKPANYGKDVTLKFKNLGSKVRVALYETIPGYSVKDVKFYTVDGTNTGLGATSTDATLISANANGLPIKGTVAVYFPHVGTDNESSEADYDKAATTVTAAASAGSSKTQTFGALTDQLTTNEGDEANSNDYLGRSLSAATFAGDDDADFYQAVFPVSSSDPLTLRVDYTLVSIDGSGEEINIYGAKAVVPATYTKWLPNYAYTYIFKISDNTKGWTKPDGSSPAGLFPITFDALVAEATDANAEQTTVTTVATPSITTYQQGHTYATNEYSIAAAKNVYVQVMDNSTVPATLVNSLSNTNSLLYAVSDADATEAEVMDALEKRTTAIGADNVTGRNGITLTKNSNISNTVTSIVNGVVDDPITVTAGEAAQIAIGSLSAGTYAYVYDYTTGSKTTVTEYQPIAVTTGSAIGSGSNYASITTTTLNGISTTTAANEAVDNRYIYFSKTTNGGATTTYSYISVSGKSNLPKGLIKVLKSSLTTGVAGTTNAVAGTFYFDVYTTNNGQYAVKVIKVIA
ncbi:MAG: hypothetical protein II826_03685 [Prevotella sp.]|nr:hypothetical protein [Prevotella sp.]